MMGKFPSAIVLSNVLLALLLSVERSTCAMEDVYSWKQLDFEYPNDEMRQMHLKSGAFKPDTIMVSDADIWNNKLFLSMPRVQGGTPASLAYINLDAADKTPKLMPYPDWESHQLDNNSSSKIVCASKMMVDACDRLWVIDDGVTDTSNGLNPARPMRILVFDLNTDKLIDHHLIHKTTDEAPVNIIVDATKDRCDKAFAYALTPKDLIVYDFAAKSCWNYTQDNIEFHKYVAGFSAPDAEGFRSVHFTLPSGDSQFTISTKVLKDRTKGSNSQFKLSGVTSPIGGGTYDVKTKNFFFTMFKEHTVSCWNPTKPTPNIANLTTIEDSADSKTVFLLTGVTVDGHDNIWLVRNYLPKGGEKSNPENPRLVISKASIAELIKGTACEAA